MTVAVTQVECLFRGMPCLWILLEFFNNVTKRRDEAEPVKIAWLSKWLTTWSVSKRVLKKISCFAIRVIR